MTFAKGSLYNSIFLCDFAPLRDILSKVSRYEADGPAGSKNIEGERTSKTVRERAYLNFFLAHFYNIAYFSFCA
jgi:hypothetical protein